jgi:DNA-directed RNA polymerase subunit RPC12/RpoP
MSPLADPLRECDNCGRTFNEDVNYHCPECGTEFQSETFQQVS